jgi:alcohol dehydrogenase class IV
MATISKDEKLQRNYNEALPALSLVPTTAGTGSDGGKSAVISMTNGRKLVFGHPSLMAPTVALNPAYTISMPARMTAATGVDALLHSLEAYFVTHAAAVNDGLNDEEIGITDGYALKGVKLILDNLPKVMANPKDLAARQQMQIAALYGAKAFRKGDLGAVHATAHTIGALHHLHHGEAIARMTVPVFRYNETRASDETSKKFDNIREIFNKHGYKGATLSESVSSFLKTLNLPYGLEGIEHRNDWDNMADMASKDGCGTNPIKLSVDDYRKIFLDAAKL